MNKVSVIIPMYNSEIFLDDLFASFDKCNFIDGDEIIIIDNGSTDKSREKCEKKRSQCSGLYKIYDFTEKADSYASRNFGVRHAGGDILAFTDSDCKPSPQWLETVRNNINRGEVMAGDVILEVKSKSIWELFDSVAHLSQCKSNAEINCVATANMAVYRTDYEKVGFFKEQFSGGDFDWSNRAAEKGLKVVYHPEAFVNHPSRKSYEEIKNREKRVAYGRGVHQRLEGKPYISLIAAYILRIFKLDTQFKYSAQMRSKGAKISELIKFNAGFLAIRLWYVVYVSRGFKGKDPRRYGIK